MRFFSAGQIGKITLLLMGTILLVIYTPDYAHPEADGLLKQKFQSASPGYINAAKQKTDYIINQAPKEDGFLKEVIDYLKNELSFKLAGGGNDKNEVDLKKKTSSTNSDASANLKASLGSEYEISDSTKYDIEKYGKGDSQIYENGRLISEVINGVKHIYVGFENAGSTQAQSASLIQHAIDIAEAGDLVLVGSGLYEGRIIVKNGVRLYGGYSKSGIRDIRNTATTVKGGFTADGIDKATEINGFTIKSTSVFSDTSSIEIKNGCTDALKILNNTLRDTASVGIKAENSQAIIYNNKIGGGMGFYAGYGFTFILVRTTMFAIASSNSSLTVSNNIITLTLSGIMETAGSSSLYQNNVLANNIKNFVINDGSTSVIDNNTVWVGLTIPLTLRGQSGIGVQIGSGATPTITNNIFDGLSKVFNSPDNPDMDDIYNENNVFTGDTANLGIDPSVLSPSNEFLDIRGLFDMVTYQYTDATNLHDRGYSPYYMREDYNRIILGSQQRKPGINDGFEGITNADFRERMRRERYNKLGFHESDYTGVAYEDENAGISGKTISLIVKGLIQNKESILSNKSEGTEEAIIAGVIQATLGESALSVPVNGMTDTNIQEMQIALILANVLKNPTAEQKEILDVLEAIINNVEKAGKNAGSEELIKVQNEFVQMFAAVLLTQAIPGLLKEGDMEGMRMLFLELNEEKSHVLSEYKKSIKVYYDSVVEELANNIAILQLKGILSKDMISDELRKMPRGDIDKILQEIKAKKERTEKEEYILEKEAEYERQYITPGKIFLEENMRRLLQDFTRKLNAVLQGEDLAKKDTKESSIK